MNVLEFLHALDIPLTQKRVVSHILLAKAPNSNITERTIP